MKNVYSVTQVNLYIKSIFSQDYALNDIYIRGEVSNCKYHSSGHVYFTLKDDKGAIACVMFSTYRASLGFQLKEGQSIIARGNVTVYERDGKYQLYVKEIMLDGIGVLYQRYEELKQKLELKGYFDSEYKKPIPKYASKIGIVTASTGAAIQDIINIAKRRNPYVQLVLYSALVQGVGAAESIAKGISTLDRMELDVIIVGRGGGSMEDLWAFNEEIVATTIFEASTPIISAVGHETDVTISDFVSDLRAPTPSAAAELAVPDYLSMVNNIFQYNYRLNNLIKRKIVEYNNILSNKMLRLNYLNPVNQIEQKKQYLMDLEDRLNKVILDKLRNHRHRIDLLTERLNASAPMLKLDKGYAFIQDDEGNVVTSVSQVEKGQRLKLYLADGELFVDIIDKNNKRWDN